MLLRHGVAASTAMQAGMIQELAADTEGVTEVAMEVATVGVMERRDES